VDSENGWIAGSNGTLLVTGDGGRNWKRSSKFTDDNIRDVYFIDRMKGWLLCERDIYGSGGNSPSYLLKTSDGGINWERINFAGETPRLLRIIFTKSGQGFAFGEGGAFGSLLDDGKIWKRNLLPVQYLIAGGAFLDELSGVLVGGGGTVLFTGDGGSEWTRATSSESARTKLNSVFFANKKNGWTAGAKGKIYVTRNGGMLWREQTSGTGEDLLDISFLNQSEGFAVGDKGTILRTTTGGETWTTESTNSKNRLERIIFVGRKGYTVGFGGEILTYDPPKAIR